MSDATDRTEALARLIDLAQPDVNPKLTYTGEGDGELGKILDNNRRAMTWVANTELKVGKLFSPSTPNGRWYRVKVPAAGSNVEPTWTGSSFEDAGEAQDNIYDIRAAAWEAWDLKARKASTYPVMSGINVSTIFDHCILIRDGFAPVLVA